MATDVRGSDVYRAWHGWRQELVGVLRGLDSAYVEALVEDVGLLRRVLEDELHRRAGEQIMKEVGGQKIAQKK